MSEHVHASASHTVLMVRPVAFGSNPETAASNAFQIAGERGDDGSRRDEIVRAARREFDGLVRAVEVAGVEVIVVDDTAEGKAPDAVFPNNWISFHRDGTVVLYPMMSVLRRGEVRRDVVDCVRAAGFAVDEVVDLTDEADRGRFLEGTGSLVFDHVGRTVFACRSPRTDSNLAARVADRFGFDLFLYDAVDDQDVPIYHTNVCLSVGRHLAAVCIEAVRDEAQRRTLRERLEAPGRTVIEISLAQMANFAGNVIELTARDGAVVVAMSVTASDALGETAWSAGEENFRLAVAPIPTIERHGGGSVRCMLAEIFLPRS